MNLESMNTQQAWDLVGGLSKPSKRPGWAYGLPAKECKTGSKLRDVKGSEVGLFDEIGSIYTKEVLKVFRDENWLPVEHV